MTATYLSGAYLARYDHVFQPSDLICTAALSLYSAATGGAGLYGNALAVGPFAYATAQTIPSMISENLAFWTTDQADFDSGTSFKGFSSTTPREYFDSWPIDKGSDRLGAGQGSWEFGFNTGGGDYGVLSQTYAMGLWAIGEASGASHAIIVDVWPWLMGFVSNPTNEQQAGESPSDLAVSGHGVYDPTIALSQILLVQRSGAPIATNFDAQYNLPTVGLLARVQAGANSGALDRSKKILSDVRPRGDASGQPGPLAFDEPRLQSYCGLSFQISDAVVYIARAAQFGLAYRFGTNFPTPVRP